MYILDIFWEECSNIWKTMKHGKLWKWKKCVQRKVYTFDYDIFHQLYKLFVLCVNLFEVLAVSYIKNYYKSLKWYIFMIYRFKICQKYTKDRRHVSREKLKTVSSAKLLQLPFTRMLYVSLFLWQQTLWRIWGFCRVCTF